MVNIRIHGYSDTFRAIFFIRVFSQNDINICKATVLASNGVIKGIAFVDFYNKDHMEDILNSTTKFKIGFNILNIERKKAR